MTTSSALPKQYDPSEVEPRWLLSDVLRGELGLTGTHVGCEHGACGACTVLVNDEPVRSCLMFAVQADQAAITTVEGLAPGGDADLNPLQEAFRAEHKRELHGKAACMRGGHQLFWICTYAFFEAASVRVLNVGDCGALRAQSSGTFFA